MLASPYRGLFALRLFVTAVCLGLMVGLCLQSSQAADPPTIPREFRAAWIATVANIDWPSKRGLPAAKQKAELVRLLDKAAALNLNAVVLQVRPACDAIYPSKLEPWSEFLTGQMGKASKPAYDPLAFAVEQAHRRGLQLHAWFNPYRASHPSGKGPISARHVSNKLPEAVVEYGDYLWLDPSNPQAAQHSLDVILDVVRRYDIDGVHFDDYFYPYPINEKPLATEGNQKPTARKLPFPDDKTWKAYVDATPKQQRLSRDDWRRESVNRFIRNVYEEVKREKPWVLFGVSPFGIWRPGTPESVVGFDAYENLYADSRLWLREGWVDYFTPQLYWQISSKGQSYPVLLDWWRQQNLQQRHLWPGNYTSRVRADGSDGWTAQEIVDQVALTQSLQGVGGNIHFSMKALADNFGGVADALLAGPYAEPAVVPETPWVAGASAPPAPPQAGWTESSGNDLAVEPGDDRPVWMWVVQTFDGKRWRCAIHPGEQRSLGIASANGTRPEKTVVTAIDRLGRASSSVTLSTPGN
jgi:uncharacterized lipoprotein YddW (UPF0748 family)